MRTPSRLLAHLACLAFLSVLLVPSWAMAALAPTCEGLDQMTRAPVEWTSPTLLDGVCDAGSPRAAADDDLGDPRVAAMCDERGASVVAPARILPMTDDRIEAAPDARSGLDGRHYVQRSSNHGGAQTGAALADHAVLERFVMVSPPRTERALPVMFPAGEELPAHPRTIDEPPR